MGTKPTFLRILLPPWGYIQAVTPAPEFLMKLQCQPHQCYHRRVTTMTRKSESCSGAVN